MVVKFKLGKRGDRMATKTQPTKEELFISQNVPPQTTTETVSATVKNDAGKSATKTADAKLYATAQEWLQDEYSGNLEMALAVRNANAKKTALANARQAAWMFLQGPAKKIYAAAGKMVRDSRALTPDGSATLTAREAFDIIKSAYSKLYSQEELNTIEFDESKINTERKSKDDDESSDE